MYLQDRDSWLWDTRMRGARREACDARNCGASRGFPRSAVAGEPGGPSWGAWAVSAVSARKNASLELLPRTLVLDQTRSSPRPRRLQDSRPPLSSPDASKLETCSRDSLARVRVRGPGECRSPGRVATSAFSTPARRVGDLRPFATRGSQRAGAFATAARDDLVGIDIQTTSTGHPSSGTRINRDRACPGCWPDLPRLISNEADPIARRVKQRRANGQMTQK